MTTPQSRFTLDDDLVDPTPPHATGQSWRYDYDHLNRLAAATLFAANGTTVLKKVALKYDVFGNRVEKKVDTNGDGTWDDIVFFPLFSALSAPLREPSL